MMSRKLILTTAAAALLAAPLAAQAAPVRTSSPVAETEDLSQGVLFILGASLFTILVLLIQSGNDSPVSP
jgi:hypothetical protein